MMMGLRWSCGGCWHRGRRGGRILILRAIRIGLHTRDILARAGCLLDINIADFVENNKNKKLTSSS